MSGNELRENFELSYSIWIIWILYYIKSLMLIIMYFNNICLLHNYKLKYYWYKIKLKNFYIEVDNII